MKIRVTFKDPDGPAECIDEAVKASVQAQGITDPDEAEAVFDLRRAEVKKRLGRWLKYGEYVVIEFDTDAGTATVLPAGN